MILSLKDKKTRRLGFFVALGIHGFLLAIFVYGTSWYSDFIGYQNTTPTPSDSSLVAFQFSKTSTKNLLEEDLALLEKIKQNNPINPIKNTPEKVNDLPLQNTSYLFKSKNWKLNCPIELENPYIEKGNLIFDLQISPKGKILSYKIQKTNISAATIKIYQKKIETKLRHCLTTTQKNVVEVSPAVFFIQLNPT